MKYKYLILTELFSGIEDWFLYGDKPKGMPAVYNFFKIVGYDLNTNFIGIVYNKKISRIIEFENGSKIYVIQSKLFKNYHFLWKSVVFIKTIVKTHTLLKKNNFDIIYGMANSALIASLFGRIKNIKSVGRVFGTLSTELIKQKKWFKLFSRHIIDILIVRFPPKILISTQDGTDYEFFANYFNPKKYVHLLLNGIDKDYKEKLTSLKIKRTEVNQPIKFVYIARLSEWKRQDLAIDLIVALRNNKLNCYLTIIGNGPNGALLQKKINESNMQDYITIKKNLPQEDLPKILEENHISMFLYNNGNLGNILWESSLAGKLIIIRKTGNFHNIVTSENSIIIDENFSVSEVAVPIINELFQNNKQQLIRNNINNLLLNWEDRIKYEINLIDNEIS